MASRVGTVETERFFVKIGGAVGDIGEIKFGFVAPKEAYEGIAAELGVNDISENSDARGIAFGIDYPKPPRVRINFKGTGNNNRKKSSTTRYCDPDKIGRVLNGSLNDEQITVAGTKFNITSVSMAN